MRGGEARARSASLVALALIACSSDEARPAPASDAGTDAPVVDASVVDAPASDARPDAGEPKAIATSPGKDEDPSIIRASDGTFRLAFYSNRDGNDRIWLTTSPDGTTWSAPVAITEPTEHAFYPCLLESADGRMHLTYWAGEVGDGGKIIGRIRYQNPSGTQTLTDAAGLAWGATIVERTPGTLFMVWSSDAAGDKDLYTAESTNGGASWSTPVRRVDPAFNDDLPYVAAKADGSLVMVWQRFDEAAKAFEDYATHPSNELAFVTSMDGTSWSTPVVVTADPPSQRVPDVIPALMPSLDPTGFSVVWSSIRLGAQKGNVYMMPLSTGPAVNGSPTGPAIVQLTPDGDYGARVVPLVNGSQYLMVWVKDLDIWARRL